MILRMATTSNLTPTAAIVLGLVEQQPGATPYELKGMLAIAIGNFWSIPHAQVYREAERLAAAGLLEEQREEAGRRRRQYRVTAEGRAALDAWRAEPADRLAELRDPALLQLFLGADPGPLAAVQARLHEAKLAEYEARHEQIAGHVPRGVVLALEAGIAHERVLLAFWQELAPAR